MNFKPIIRFLAIFSSAQEVIHYLFRSITGNIVNRLQWVVVCWNRLSHFKQNVVIGILIALVLHYMHATQLVRQMEDLAMDSIIEVRSGTADMMAKEFDKNLSFVFLDIDEKTYTKWEEPFYTPRDKIAKLLSFSINSEAEAIIIDIDLSKAGYDKEADQALAKTIINYPADAPELILTRGIRPAETENQLDRSLSFYFENELKHKENIHFAEPQFLIDSYDRNVRRWILAKEVCHDGKASLLPSVQLVLDIILAGDTAKLSDITTHDEQGGCINARSGEDHYRINYAGRDIDLSNHGQAQRLIFTIKPEATRGIISNELLSIPAYIITDHAGGSISNESLKNAVVMIGASHSAAGDIYLTPVGELPGALVIVNAIKSLHLYGQIKMPPGWVKLIIELILILVMAYLFAKWPSRLASNMTFWFIMISLFPISFYFIKAGVWVDFAGPLIGMKMHTKIARIEEIHKQEKLKKNQQHE